MVYAFRLSSLITLLLVSACATLPEGPSVLVLPGTGKSFDQFRADDSECRQYASGQVGGTTPAQASSESGVRSAAVGTVLGSAAGAAISGASGAAIGAGAGLVAGALVGTGTGESSAYAVQRRYDFGFLQCMYAKGHKIPVYGRFVSSRSSAPVAYTPPPPPPPPPPSSSR